MANITYRPEIDGLRAIAVLSVVAFHAFPDVVTGGYVGVDIFFVISGFLITSIIADSIQRSHYSLVEFYDRRARRILPALFFMIACTAAAGYVIMLPQAFEEFGASIIATSLFSSNFFFWKNQSDYFAGPSEFAPLLHTWSLGVEEQFYILAPIILFLAFRNFGRRGAFYAVLALTLTSLATSIYVTPRHSGASFYLPFTRSYELGVGALIALAPLPLLPRLLREALAVLGLLIIVAVFVTYDAATLFPSWTAFLPCLGTALCILTAKRDTVVGQVLSRGPIVYVGLISYSLYLWHWPILVLARHYSTVATLTPWAVLSCVLLAFAAAMASHRFIERPFRSRTAIVHRRTIFTVSGAAIMGTFAIGATIYISGGIPARIGPEAQAIIAVTERPKPLSVPCAYDRGFSFCRSPRVVTGEAPRILFAGDSHAAASGPFILEALDAEGLPAISITRDGCPPLPGLVRTSMGSTDRICPGLAERLLSTLGEIPEIETVVIHGRWALYGTGERFQLEPGTPVVLSDASGVPNRDPETNLLLLQDKMRILTEEIAALGRNLAIVGSVPEIGWNVPHALANEVRFGIGLPKLPTVSDYSPESRGRTDIWLADFAERNEHLSYFSVIALFCTPECVVWDQNMMPYYWDTNHLSGSGARMLAAHLAKHFAEILSE